MNFSVRARSVGFPGNSFVACPCLRSESPNVTAQSGRRKDPKPKADQPPSPIAEASRPPVRKARSSTASPSPRSTGDEVERADVVRVSSNLVPIPASVVDNKGMALTTLKARRLRIVGRRPVKPISDITRSDSPVRLAMLFDNSGSLDMAREL